MGCDLKVGPLGVYLDEVHDGISTLIKSGALSLHLVGTGHNKKSLSARGPSPVSKIVRNKHVLVQSPSLWYIVTQPTLTKTGLPGSSVRHITPLLWAPTMA